MKEIAPKLWWWTEQHPDWTPEDLEDGKGWDRTVSCYALAAEGAVVLVDPLLEDWEAVDGLVEQHGLPSVLITIMWHVRSSQEILDRYEGASVWVHEPAAAWIGERTDYTDTFNVGDDLPGRVEAIHMRRIEEVAYWLPEHNSVVVGDTVLGHGDRAELCPATWVRKSETIEPAVQAVRELMERKPESLLLTHGGPTDPDVLEI